RPEGLLIGGGVGLGDMAAPVLDDDSHGVDHGVLRWVRCITCTLQVCAKVVISLVKRKCISRKVQTYGSAIGLSDQHDGGTARRPLEPAGDPRRDVRRPAYFRRIA